MFSNPDHDYPCNRVFWETDEQYERRYKRMSTIKGLLKNAYYDKTRLTDQIESNKRMMQQLGVWFNSLTGLIPDSVVRQQNYFFESLSSQNTRLNQELWKTNGNISKWSKELSELTR